MAMEKQFSIFVQNKAGSLSTICTCLAERGINVRAVSVIDDLEWGIVRLISEDPEGTRAVLQDLDMMYGENQVLTVQVANHPGALAQLAETLAEENINIEQAYATAIGPKTILVLSTTDDQKAEAALTAKPGRTDQP